MIDADQRRGGWRVLGVIAKAGYYRMSPREGDPCTKTTRLLSKRRYPKIAVERLFSVIYVVGSRFFYSNERHQHAVFTLC
jgi:hypothetical protein